MKKYSLVNVSLTLELFVFLYLNEQKDAATQSLDLYKILNSLIIFSTFELLIKYCISNYLKMLEEKKRLIISN